MDTLQQFCEDCLEDDDRPGAPGVKASDMFDLYERWADDTNAFKMTATRFGKEITKRYSKVKNRNGWHYMGCKFSLYADSNYRTLENMSMFDKGEKVVKFNRN
jgi:putative DNA primase/helicase